MADAATGDRRYRVTKMKFGKRKDPETGKSVNDKITVIYNDFIAHTPNASLEDLQVTTSSQR